MPVVTFTARFVESLAPPSAGQCDYWDRTIPGFGLRVSFGGRKAWVVPSTAAKNKRSHRVPLNPPAVTMLRALKAAANENATWVCATSLIDTPAVHDAKKAVARIRRRVGFDFRGHDLRRTAASQMTSVGVPRLVVAKILNHVETDVTAVYDRHSYDAEKRAALDVWARELQRILRSRRKPTILPFSRARHIPEHDARRESA